MAFVPVAAAVVAEYLSHTSCTVNTSSGRLSFFAFRCQTLHHTFRTLAEARIVTECGAFHDNAKAAYTGFATFSHVPLRKPYSFLNSICL
jgi:hypothetical protein